MIDILSLFLHQFHFLRPLWLLMLLPCSLLITLLWKQPQSLGNWSNVIDSSLLPWLLDGEQQKSVRWPLHLVLAGWVIASFALAGPAWQKQPVPISKNQQPWVVAVDLSYHMYATDLSPNRLTRIRFKLQDLFNLRSEGFSALIAYAGSAHTVAPLTDDSHTLINLTKALAPEIMPVQGNNPTEAVRLAKQLLTQSGNESGDILLLTGSMTEKQVKQITELLQSSDIHLSVLGIGTEQGAPIPLPEGGYLKDNHGTIIVPQLEQPLLQSLTRSLGGRYQTMTVADDDLKSLLPTGKINQIFSEQVSTDREFNQWYDAGYWLVWLLLPVALLGFRRGWLVVLMLTLLPITQDTMAFNWDDLWLTRDQQGAKALQEGNPELAARLFKTPSWKAEALFQSQQFEESASTLNTQRIDSGNAILEYNRANALAKAGKLQEAIDGYDQALALQPDMDDARFNRNLVEQLLKQQSQQNQESNKAPKKDQQQSGQERDNQQSQTNENPSDSQNTDRPESSASQDKDHGKTPRGSGADSQQQDSSSTEQNQKTNQQQTQPNQTEEDAPDTSQPSGRQEEPDKNRDKSQQTRTGTSDRENDEQPLSPEQQAIESWLRTIPDDPGGLLRRKFLQQHRSAQQQKMMEGASW